MSLHVISDPRHARQAVVRALRTLNSGTREIALATRAPHTISTSLPHILYDVKLADVAAGKLLDAARSVAWRYLIERDELPIAIAETSLPNARERVTVLGFESDRAATTLSRALERVEQDARLAGEDFELRVLRVLPLYLSCLWLHGPRHDWVIPFGSCPPSITSGQRYTPAKLTSLTAPLAKKRIASERKLQKGTR